MSDRVDFITRFGGVFEHSPWIAERAYDHGRIRAPLKDSEVWQALCAEFRAASPELRLGVLRAHPDLAGRLAIENRLTTESRSEQSGAGLDRLSVAEHARFTELNSEYTAKFGFPFIIAVKGLDRSSILEAFERRIANSAEVEFGAACAEVERIAGFRISALLPET